MDVDEVFSDGYSNSLSFERFVGEDSEGDVLDGEGVVFGDREEGFAGLLGREEFVGLRLELSGDGFYCIGDHIFIFFCYFDCGNCLFLFIFFWVSEKYIKYY